jgi:hypothetical protein
MQLSLGWSLRFFEGRYSDIPRSRGHCKGLVSDASAVKESNSKDFQNFVSTLSVAIP